MRENTDPKGTAALEEAERLVKRGDPRGEAFAQLATAYFMKDLAEGVWSVVQLVFDEGRPITVTETPVPIQE